MRIRSVVVVVAVVIGSKGVFGPGKLPICPSTIATCPAALYYRIPAPCLYVPFHHAAYNKCWENRIGCKTVTYKLELVCPTTVNIFGPAGTKHLYDRVCMCVYVFECVYLWTLLLVRSKYYHCVLLSSKTC